MPSSKPKSLLEWITPSMMQDGLIVPAPWQSAACAEAVETFADSRLHLPATVLTALHPFILDFIKQAPVVVVTAAAGRNFRHRADRLNAARRLIAAGSAAPRLKDLMAAYGLAPQLRAISGQVLEPGHHRILQILSGIPPSTLAQAIPTTIDGQRRWLRMLERWRLYTARAGRRGDGLLAWAAVHMQGPEAQNSLNEMLDFVLLERSTFNAAWTFVEAKAASDRWHAELLTQQHRAPVLHPEWDLVVDYEPLPATAEIGAFQFTALQSRAALHEESLRMHHCVRLYGDRIKTGKSRIYAMSLGPLRIATLELTPSHRRRRTTSYEQVQLKGPYNGRVAADVSDAAAAFIKAANGAIAAKAKAKTTEPTATTLAPKQNAA